MIPIPAIDIQDGKCVRLKMGDLDSAITYYENPIDAANFWLNEGTRKLHIVDLDGALAGQSSNLSVIASIRKTFPELEIQLGGGIRNMQTLENYFDIGINYLILGSVAIKDKDFFFRACRKFPNKVILGIDAKNGYVSTEAWTESSDILAIEILKEFSELPINSLIYTDISKDGMMQGPNFKETKQISSNTKIPVIASGGVRNLSDLKELSKIDNIFGAICGKSLYEGTLNFSEALNYFKNK
ncbi:MAG: 1-(5-phosphoribosyl)-5-[(5-phosphoribosylamino)methylideneamino]imidazole-4-carboxamide isomerase [Gammaproteobacteria bacterium]|tara:strand:+ start:1353 stop:2078 length:726 start_codon:yes stop_codon:yes gene_type:complete